MKGCSTSLVILENTLRNAMKYHARLTRMAVNKKMENNESWQGCGKLELAYIACGNIKWRSPMGNSLVVLQILKQGHPQFYSLGLYLRQLKMETCSHRMSTQVFLATLFIIVKKWKQLKIFQVVNG